jgi:oxygen-independent coproporphyrinogen-3 oxidase
VFGYAHVPWMKPHQKAIRAEELPDAALRMRQAEAATRILTAAGYVAIGLDHFARPEDPMARAAQARRLRRNFQGYTTDEAPFLLGFGASAISRTPRGYAQNAADERAWLAAVQAGRLPVARGRTLSAEDIARAAAIERVMCDAAIDTAALPRAVMASAAARLAALEADGLVRRESGRVAVTEAGRPFLRHVAACFDVRLAAGRGRHSSAV